MSLAAVHGHLSKEHVVGVSEGVLNQHAADAPVPNPGGVRRPSATAVGRYLLQVLLYIH